LSEHFIDIEEFKKIDLRVAYVKKAEKIPGSKKLLRLIVDLGSEERQIITGLAQWYRPEDLVGKYIIVVANLKPKKFMGYESRGMLLATCNDDEKPVLITVAEPVKPGTRVC